MAGQQGVLQLGDHRLLVAEHPGEQRLAGPDLGDGVAPELLLDRPGAHPDSRSCAEGGGEIAALAMANLSASGRGGPRSASP